MLERFIRRVEELRTASGRIEDGTSDGEVVEAPLGGGRIRITGQHEGWVEYSGPASSASVRSRRFPPSDARPEGYPEDLPFLASRPCSLVELPRTGRRIVRWASFPEAPFAFRDLQAASMELGWVQGESRDMLFGLLGREARFDRHGADLTVSMLRIPARSPTLRLVVDRQDERGSA